MFVLVLRYGKILNRSYYEGTSLKDIEVTTAPMVVLSYGRNVGTQKDFGPINRVNGRKDYQLLYISSGSMEFTLDNKKVTYGENTLILFRPGEPQIYGISPDVETTSCFIHFSGSEVEKFLERYSINQQVITFAKPFGWFEKIINDMDANSTYTFREDICNNLLAALLAIIGGILKEEQPIEKGFSRITHMMRANCMYNYPISLYAERFGFSEIYFISFFKQKLGITPHKYIIRQRMQLAKTLLLTTKDSVKSIAVQVGYPNSRYFSRVFYKKFRLTPSEFRAQSESSPDEKDES